MNGVASMSPDQLRREVASLTQRLQALHHAQGPRDETGMMRRAAFLEAGAAEFRRARRYERSLGLLVLRVLPTVQEGDLERAHAMADLLAGVLRDGIDQPGRLDASSWGVLLPETGLSGALALADRMRHAASRLRLPTERGTLRLAGACSADALLIDDERFKTMLDRAVAALSRSVGEGSAEA